LVSLVRIASQLPILHGEGDLGFLELYTLRATEGLQLTGPYSQRLWHHPGPAYFYLLAPLYRLSHGNVLSLEWSALLINLTAAILTLVVIWRMASRAVVYASAILFPLYLVYLSPGFLTSSWNPDVPILPFVLFLVLCAAVFHGDLLWLPVVTAIASFTIQTHISYGPLVLGISAVALVGGLVPAARHRIEGLVVPASKIRRWLGLVGAIVVLALMWYPVVLEQLTVTPGNLTLLFEFFTTGHDLHGILESFELLAQMLPGPLLALPVLRNLPGDSEPEVVILTALALVQVMLVHLSCLLVVRRRATFLAPLAVIAVLGSWISLWATTRIAGDLGDYMVKWASGLGLVDWIVIGGALGPLIAGRLLPDRPGRRVVGVVAGSAIVIWAGATSLAQAQIGPQVSVAESSRVDAMAGSLEEFLTQRQDTTWLIRVDPAAWPFAVGLAIQMEKDHVPYTVEDRWISMFGTLVAPTGREDGEIVIADQSPDTGFVDRHFHELIVTDNQNALYARQDRLALAVRPNGPLHRTALQVGSDIIVTSLSAIKDRYQPGELIVLGIDGVARVKVQERYAIVGRLIGLDGSVRSQTTLFVPSLNRTPDLSRGDPFEYQLILPVPTDAPRGLYTVNLVFFRIPTWAAVPVAPFEEPPGDDYHVGSILVAPTAFWPQTAISEGQSSEYWLGDEIGMSHATDVTITPTSVSFNLDWQAERKLDRDYTIFVQLLDPSGRLVAQSDGFPWGGGFPTSRWVPGQIIRDHYQLALPNQPRPGDYRIIVGAYQLETMRRLPTTDRQGHSLGDFVGVVHLQLP
jgi:hypothetical protein